MRQKTLIILGIVVIILLLAVWVYLLFFNNTDQTEPGFIDLPGNDGKDGGVVVPPPPIVESPDPDAPRPRLRQLTTKPVIGFAEVQATATDPIYVRYVETGTGHIYEIDLASSQETRISNYTIKDAAVAEFSPDGLAVAVRSRTDRRSNELLVGQINKSAETLETTTIKDEVFDFTMFSTSSIGYTTETKEGMTAYNYNLNSSSLVKMFNIPFYEAAVRFGEVSEASHVVYPKPSYALEGYLYTFTKGKMERLPAQGFGLTAFNSPNHIVYTRTLDNEAATFVYDKKTRERDGTALILLPEKCAVSLNEADTAWCAYGITKLPRAFPDDWYKGVFSFRDSIWKINLNTLEAEESVDTFAESGRPIDIDDMIAGDSGTALYFTNKYDNTLWLYEL